MGPVNIPEQSPTGLVLTGGGARAAYQIGVLRAVARLLPSGSPSPFPIICGTSAGAINAAGVAAGANDFRRTVQQLARVWKEFRTAQVYRSDALSVMSTGARWLATLVVGGLGRNNPTSLLDNTPLAQLLAARLDLSGIQLCINAGYLKALSVTASGYTSGESVSFCQGEPGLVWVAPRAPRRNVHVGRARALDGFVCAAVHLSGGADQSRVFRRRLHAPDRAA